MADVFVCRLPGIGGFGKEVVIKRIIPERAGDPHFVKMFLDEARVVANFNHPNIVQVFEIGEQDGIPFMAMEYVKGVTLNMVIQQAHRQRKIQYGLSATIIAGVCNALEYAHNAVGPDGEPLALVHRDVTPGNVVVSREGTPKLLDFGVARARGRLAQTEAGTIKGKLRYMAPEQISQGPLDHRADIFSLGVCLFELTTGQHPFGPRTGSEVATLRNIMNGVMTKPSDIVPGYPPALERIVMSAIEPDVHKRCPTAHELGERLEAWVATSGYPSSNREVVAWLRELFPDFNNLTNTGGLTAFTGSASLPVTPGGSQVPRLDTGLLRTTGGSPLPPLPPPKNSGWKWSVATLLFIGGGALAAYLFRPYLGGDPPAPVAQTSQAPAAPALNLPPTMSDDDAAAAYLDAAEKAVQEKRFDPALDMLAKAKDLKIRRPDLNIRLTNLNDALATSMLLRKAHALINEKDMRGAMEAAKSALDRDPDNKEALQVLATARAALQPRPVETSGRNKERVRDGALTISTTPPAMVYVNDEPIGRSPISNYNLPAGRHQVQVRAQGYRLSETEIKVVPRQTVALVLPLVAESAPAPSRMAAREPDHRSAAREPDHVPAASARIAGSAGPTEVAPKIEPEPAAIRPPPAAPPPTSAPPPAPAVAGMAPAAPKAPSTGSTGSLISATPKSPIPKPTLPRAYLATDAEQLVRVCALVESTIVSAGGVSPEYARGITGPFRRLVGTNSEVYPVAMYYFLIREAALKRDQKSAAAALAGAHSNGTILKFKNLPAIERNL